MNKKYEFLLVNLPLNDGQNNHSEIASKICDFLAEGWEIVNSTGAGRGVFYILKKKAE